MNRGQESADYPDSLCHEVIEICSKFPDPCTGVAGGHQKHADYCRHKNDLEGVPVIKRSDRIGRYDIQNQIPYADKLRDPAGDTAGQTEEGSCQQDRRSGTEQGEQQKARYHLPADPFEIGGISDPADPDHDGEKDHGTQEGVQKTEKKV